MTNDIGDDRCSFETPRLARQEQELTEVIIGLAFEVHNELGPGFSEKIYGRAMTIALEDAHCEVDREFPIALRFRGRTVGAYRLDFVVNRSVILEIKALPRITGPHVRQLANYLRAANRQLGLVINFGDRVSIRRVNGLSIKSKQ